jgi:chromosome segregation ATPase
MDDKEKVEAYDRLMQYHHLTTTSPTDFFEKLVKLEKESEELKEVNDQIIKDFNLLRKEYNNLKEKIQKIKEWYESELECYIADTGDIDWNKLKDL